MPPFQRAAVHPRRECNYGGCATIRYVSLQHPDGTTTEYPGPGHDNDRSAEVVVLGADVEGVRLGPTKKFGQAVYMVTLGVRDRAAIDLGMRYGAKLYAEARARSLEAQLMPLLEA